MGRPEDLELRTIGDILHKRLIEGDVTASAEIAELFLPRVIYKLEQYHPNLSDPHLVQMAVDDAIMNYFERPQQYDPSQLSLESYLVMAARSDFLNLLRGSKFRGFPKRIEFVELDASSREHKIEIEDETLNVEDQAMILSSPVWELLTKLLPGVTDRELALLMLEGVRETDEYARALGIHELPKRDQEIEVKRHKDRIKKFLKRHIDPSELDETV